MTRFLCWLRRLFGVAPKLRVVHRRLARLRTAPVRCSLCSEPLLDTQLVTWHEAREPAWRGPLSHAACSVHLVAEDGTVRMLDGTIVPRDANGGIESRVGMLLLTPTEWKAWLATEGDRASD